MAEVRLVLYLAYGLVLDAQGLLLGLALQVLFQYGFYGAQEPCLYVTT